MFKKELDNILKREKQEPDLVHQPPEVPGEESTTWLSSFFSLTFLAPRLSFPCLKRCYVSEFWNSPAISKLRIDEQFPAGHKHVHTWSEIKDLPSRNSCKLNLSSQKHDFSETRTLNLVLKLCVVL